MYENIKTFTNDPYWNRAWITQEFLLSNVIVFVTSKDEYRWTDVGRCILQCEDHQDTQLKYFWHGSTPRFFWDWKTSVEQLRGHYHLSDLLQKRSSSHCTDRLDRIYSLLSLVDRGHEFRVDYNESPVDLFWRTGEHFGVWSHFECVMALFNALDVSIDGLEKSSESLGSQDVTLHLRSEITRTMPTDRAFICRYQQCLKDYRGLLPRDNKEEYITLCTNNGSGAFLNDSAMHVHLRASQSSNGGTFELTRTAFNSWNFGDNGKNVGHIEHHVNQEWQRIKSLDYVKQNIMDERLLGGWRLRVPKRQILEQMKIRTRQFTMDRFR